jgi:chromosome partitioning protein
MRTLAVVGRKGGSGKTTVAVNLAMAAHRRGKRVLIADSDPQRSALAAVRGRTQAGPQCVATTGAKLFALQVAAVRDGYDLMLVDTPACGEEDLGHALVLSEMSLLALRPTFLDLAAAVRTVDVANRLGRPAVAVVNQAPPARLGAESLVVKRALEALALMRLPVAPAIIRSRLDERLFRCLRRRCLRRHHGHAPEQVEPPPRQQLLPNRLAGLRRRRCLCARHLVWPRLARHFGLDCRRHDRAARARRFRRARAVDDQGARPA